MGFVIVGREPGDKQREGTEFRQRENMLGDHRFYVVLNPHPDLRQAISLNLNEIICRMGTVTVIQEIAVRIKGSL